MADNKPDISSHIFLQELVDKYFNGTTTPEENHILLEAAQNSLPDNAELSDSLSSIVMIHESLLAEAELVLPCNFENTLESQLSRLARKGRRIHRVLWIISSAAAIAIILTIGLPILNSYETASSAPELFSEVKTESENHDNQPNQQQAQIPVENTHLGKVAGQNVSFTKSTHKRESFIEHPQTSLKHDLPTLTASVTRLDPPIVIPEVPNPDFYNDRILNDALACQSYVLEQPLTTLSQALWNVFETIEAVSSALTLQTPDGISPSASQTNIAGVTLRSI